MDIKKPITNPMLVGAMELLNAENTPEHRKIFFEEVVKAVFLAPVVIDPPPVADGQGMFRIPPESRVQFPLLKAPDGKQFFMAYTDWDELQKWNNQDNQQTFGLKLTDYADMVFKRNESGEMNPVAGVVINPYGGNMALTKEMIAGILMPKPPRS
ncbi:MAG: SseB family protein [Bacteroidales bacterium]|nr:SseB family protein [Lachnoclostridium sp.]MCM1383964.1 SseB family protein [Lachnoclostridium sp.]MCM1464673.1 SseB family protein [Bacteroidales bacterium]